MLKTMDLEYLKEIANQAELIKSLKENKKIIKKHTESLRISKYYKENESYHKLVNEKSKINYRLKKIRDKTGEALEDLELTKGLTNEELIKYLDHCLKIIENDDIKE